MFDLKDTKSFCDYVFSELNDMKKTLNDIGEKARAFPFDDRKIVAEGFLGNLKELSNEIDAKMDTFSRYCPIVTFERGEKSMEYHAAAGV
jgi:hypothetical protein